MFKCLSLRWPEHCHWHARVAISTASWSAVCRASSLRFVSRPVCNQRREFGYRATYWWMRDWEYVLCAMEDIRRWLPGFHHLKLGTFLRVTNMNKLASVCKATCAWKPARDLSPDGCNRNWQKVLAGRLEYKWHKNVQASIPIVASVLKENNGDPMKPVFVLESPTYPASLSLLLLLLLRSRKKIWKTKMRWS